MNRSPYPTMRDRFDLRAYFVVGPDDTKGRPVADVVATALRGGATFIQLRAKHADARDLTATAEAIAAVIAQAGKADTVAFVIDDRVDAAWQCRELGIKVDGVHIGQDDMAPGQARALLGPDAIIGLSAETLPHIKAANALSDGTIDYIGAGPLHYTATKPDAAAVEADGTKHALGIAGGATVVRGEPVSGSGRRRRARGRRTGVGPDRGRRMVRGLGDRRRGRSGTRHPRTAPGMDRRARGRPARRCDVGGLPSAIGCGRASALRHRHV